MEWVKRQFARILWHIVCRLPKQDYWHLEGYMERWWLRKGESREWRWGARLHHILRSDNDRHLHDHPWTYITVILKGGYWEITGPVSPYAVADFHPHLAPYLHFDRQRDNWFLRRWYGPGSILYRKATHTHRLDVEPGKTCWTLFMMGPWQQTWGFYTEEGKVPYYDYAGAQ